MKHTSVGQNDKQSEHHIFNSLLDIRFAISICICDLLQNCAHDQQISISLWISCFLDNLEVRIQLIDGQVCSDNSNTGLNQNQDSSSI